MKVALVNQFYPPSIAPTGMYLRDLADALCDRGHEVVIITSRGRYGEFEDAVAEPKSGGTVIRVGWQRAHSKGFLGKIAEYLSFFILANRCLKRIRPEPDLLVCMTTPPFSGLLGALWKRNLRPPFVLWLMDLYPEALSAHGLLHPKAKLYFLLEKLALMERSRASYLITLGPDMSNRIAGQLPSSNIVEIPLWGRLSVDEDSLRRAFDLRTSHGWKPEETIFLYSGNIGRAHRVEEFIGLADALRERGKAFKIIVSGTGAAISEWMNSAGHRFEFIPPVDRDHLVAHLLAADVHLISLQEGWDGVVLPSKFQAACAVGRPVVFAGAADSAVAHWIREFEAGWIVPANDKEALNQVLDELIDPTRIEYCGNGSKRLGEKLFSPSKTLDRLVSVLEGLVKSDEY